MKRERGKVYSSFGAVLPSRVEGNQGRKGESGRKAKQTKILLIIAAAAILAFSLYQLIAYTVRSDQNRNAQEALRAAFYQTPIAEPVNGETDPIGGPIVPTDAPVETPAATTMAYGMVTPCPTAYAGGDRQSGSFQLVGSGDDVLDSMKKLLARNGDLVGWLKIPGVVDLPVVYRDNIYYLHRDFDGGDNVAGTLFLDSLHPFREDTQQLVIHGHNMRDGSMFGHLTRYQQYDFAAAHRSIIFTTLYREEKYEVFAVVRTTIEPKDDRYIAYLGKAKFNSEEKFHDLMAQYRRQSLYWRDTNLSADDALLTLSTCLADDRLLVIARRTGI